MYYKKNTPATTSIKVNKTVEGETIEAKMRRILNNKETIKDTAPTIYTERKDGVRPEYDIRTDKMELAAETMDKVAGHHYTKRGERAGERTYDTMSEEQRTEFHKNYPNNKLSQQATKNQGT